MIGRSSRPYDRRGVSTTQQGCNSFPIPPQQCVVCSLPAEGSPQMCRQRGWIYKGLFAAVGLDNENYEALYCSSYTVCLFLRLNKAFSLFDSKLVSLNSGIHLPMSYLPQFAASSGHVHHNGNANSGKSNPVLGLTSSFILIFYLGGVGDGATHMYPGWHESYFQVSSSLSVPCAKIQVSSSRNIPSNNIAF